MRKSILFLVAVFSLFTTIIEAGSLETVKWVDLNRYIGKWYEIARMPFFQQEGCFATTATYSVMENGEIQVLNECRDKSFEGKLRVAKGRARVLDTDTYAKLEVTFFWPFWGDYWVIALDPQYRYAMVGEPRRKYLWILSRAPQLSESVYDQLVKEAEAKGFDVQKLIKTPQKEE